MDVLFSSVTTSAFTLPPRSTAPITQVFPYRLALALIV